MGQPHSGHLESLSDMLMSEELTKINYQYPGQYFHAPIILHLNFRIYCIFHLNSPVTGLRHWRQQGAQPILGPSVAALSHITISRGSISLVATTNLPTPGLCSTMKGKQKFSGLMREVIIEVTLLIIFLPVKFLMSFRAECHETTFVTNKFRRFSAQETHAQISVG